jgi:hypothetical protein
MMDKWQELKQESQQYHYTDPFQSPRANPKHASRQINGETKVSQQGQIRRVRSRQQNMYL